MSKFWKLPTFPMIAKMLIVRQDKEERTEKNNVPTSQTTKFVPSLSFPLVFLILFLLFGVWGCGGMSEESPQGIHQGRKIILGAPMFLNGNDRIQIGFYADGARGMAIYEISSGRLKTDNRFQYLMENGGDYPTYSQDGKKIAYGLMNGNDRSIYVTDADGSNVRQITLSRNKDPGTSLEKGKPGQPSFSPDGKRIIFRRTSAWLWESYRDKELGQKNSVDWDIYEVDIETGVERKLTDYKFYDMTQPFYLPDGKRFIFSGDEPKPEGHTKAPDRYDKSRWRQQNSTIYIMDGKNNQLRPAFESPGRYAKDPVVANDGTILYKAVINDIDKLQGRENYLDHYDLFIKKGKTVKRITHMKTNIFRTAISPDGSRVVFLENSQGRFDWSVWIINSDGTGLTKINLPWEQVFPDPEKRRLIISPEQRKRFFIYLADFFLIAFLIAAILIRRRWDILWPKMTDPGVAKITAYYGIFVAFFGLYEILADACVRGSHFILANHPMVLLYMTVYAVIGLGIWKLFRIAALAILCLHIVGTITLFIKHIIHYKQFPLFQNILIAAFLILLSLNAVRGAFAWHGFKDRSETSPQDQKPEENGANMKPDEINTEQDNK